MALLPGSVRAAAPGARGFDTDQVLGASDLKELGTQYKFCLRYIPFDQPQADDFSANEAVAILESGMALMAVYPCPYAKNIWLPNAESGTRYGLRTTQNAAKLGLPQNLTIWMDLEAISPDAQASDIIDHCNNWYDEVAAQGYSPGLYVGEPCGLTGDQLFNSLKFHSYWHSQSADAPAVPVRGFQMIQYAGVPFSDFTIDPNVTQRDLLGGNAQWLIASK